MEGVCKVPEPKLVYLYSSFYFILKRENVDF